VSATVSRIKDFSDSRHAPYKHNREVGDDFFDNGTVPSADAAINAVDRECISYLSDTDTDTELKMLARCSRICKVFIKFNTTLLSPAPAERRVQYGWTGRSVTPQPSE